MGGIRKYIVALILFAASLACAAQTATVRRSSNLRQQPNTSSAILAKAKAGERVNLTGATSQGGYYPVRTSDGKSGWLWAKNLKLSGEVSPATRKRGAGGTFTQTCANPTYPSAVPGAIDSVCPAQGKGGAEAAQNSAKNQFCAPGPPRAITLADLAGLQQQVQANGTIPFGNLSKHPLSPAPGPATDRTALQAIGEGTQVVLTGYVKVARQEGSESVNCSSAVPNTPEYHDIHISIVDQPGAAECSGIVAEMIPHHRPASWTPDLVNQVATAQRQVRVTGDMMFDSSHTPCINGVPVSGDPSRVSLWEIHPIYKFEVCSLTDCSSGNGWVPIESWKP